MSQDDFARIDQDSDRVAEIAKSAVEAFINETGFDSIVAERDALKAQRDGLLEALKSVQSMCQGAIRVRIDGIVAKCEVKNDER